MLLLHFFFTFLIFPITYLSYKLEPWVKLIFISFWRWLSPLTCHSTHGNEAGVDLVLIQAFLLSYVTRAVLILASTAPFPKSRASYFRFASFNTSALCYLRAWHRLVICPHIEPVRRKKRSLFSSVIRFYILSQGSSADQVVMRALELYLDFYILVCRILPGTCLVSLIFQLKTLPKRKWRLWYIQGRSILNHMASHHFSGDYLKGRYLLWYHTTWQNETTGCRDQNGVRIKVPHITPSFDSPPPLPYFKSVFVDRH